MDRDLLCLIKFGEREYMENLAKGDFFFSHAKRFAEIEGELVKGQGDKYECKARVNVTRMKVTDNETDVSFEAKVTNLVTMTAEKVKNKPVYCITALTVEDAIQYIDDNNYEIKFSEEFINTIRTHFPKADTAVVFSKPFDLIKQLDDLSDSRLEYGFVNYFNIHPVGTEWVEFVHRKERIRNGYKYSVSVHDAYKMLFCKDLFFTVEKEYRFVHADEEIEHPEVRKFNIKTESLVVDLEQLFENGISCGVIDN